MNGRSAWQLRNGWRRDDRRALNSPAFTARRACRDDAASFRPDPCRIPMSRSLASSVRDGASTPCNRIRCSLGRGTGADSQFACAHGRPVRMSWARLLEEHWPPSARRPPPACGAPRSGRGRRRARRECHRRCAPHVPARRARAGRWRPGLSTPSRLIAVTRVFSCNAAATAGSAAKGSSTRSTTSIGSAATAQRG